MTSVHDELDLRDSQIPATVLPWLLVSTVTSHAVRLYCLYKCHIYRRVARPTGLPQSPEEYAAVLQLDDVQHYQAVHQELVDVGAVTEKLEVDDDGVTRTIFLLNDLSPSQAAMEDERHRRYMEKLEADRVAATRPEAIAKPVKGFVYVIGPADSNRVKIGYSANVSGRRKALEASSPYLLIERWKTPEGKPLEDALHERFRKCRTHGEWFDFGRRDPVAAVQKAVRELQSPADPSS